ncbi:hypothetical protein GCM10020000_21230 [Streptomyces olivoverticillatus]
MSASRAAEVSIRNSDSGVVIRMSGGRVTSARRSAAGGVAGADADADVRLGQPHPYGLLADAGERAAQIPLDVDREGLER